ncbi:MAG: HIT family protein [Syntrophobacteraceae bacterium CG2_30_61_12]|nr:MAG: HIT family protein [Syntrophobacteraceae bacterium CG2_30_61_12]
MADCIFCMIIDGRIPSAKIYEDARVLVFLDINPVVPGHTLVVPKTHCRMLWDAPTEALEACSAVLKRVAAALMTGLAAEGLNVVQNNGAVAGQEIEHVHFHLIPRYRGDGFKVPWPARPYPEGALERTLAKIKAAL